MPCDFYARIKHPILYRVVLVNSNLSQYHFWLPRNLDSRFTTASFQWFLFSSTTTWLLKLVGRTYLSILSKVGYLLYRSHSASSLYSLQWRPHSSFWVAIKIKEHYQISVALQLLCLTKVQTLFYQKMQFLHLPYWDIWASFVDFGCLHNL